MSVSLGLQKMASNKSPTSSEPLKWHFRPSLNASKTLGVIADSSTLAAFSPDIIPLDQVRASPDEIAACYNHFVAHSIDRDEATTFVHIRSQVTLPTGYSVDNAESSQVDLLAVPNELILWPDIWEKATAFGHSNLDTKNVIAPRNIVVGGPIAYKPITLPDNGQHSHETLVAIRRPSNVPRQPVGAQVNNWRDLVKYVGNNDAVSFYNATAADPRPERVTLTTKLRILENEQPFVDLYLGLEAVGTASHGVVATLRVGDGTSTIFTIGPQALLPSKDFGSDIQLPANFSGTVTLEVLNNDKETFCDYASISIVLYAVDKSPAGNHVLIGADHVFFDSNPRVKRLVRKYKPQFLRHDISEDIDDTPQFYFRDAVGDNSNFPRDENANMSPDIQPVGATPVGDPTSTFSNQYVDYSSEQNCGITANQSNYIYVSGHTTSAHKGDLRLFIIPNTVLLHPSQYNNATCIVYDIDTGDEGVPITAIRGYKATSDDTQRVLTTEPFLVVDPPDPPAGSDHYCLVTECKPHRTQKEIDEGDPPYQWPHEETGEFATTSEFSAWVLSEPRVAWRNMAFRDNYDGGSDYSVRQSFKLFSGVTPTDVLHYQIHAVNCPNGSQYSMDSSDSAIQYAKATVSTSNEGGFAEFSGKTSDFSCQVVLRWWSNGNSRNSGQRLFGQLSHQKYHTSAIARSKQLFSKPAAPKRDYQLKTQKRKLHVGDAYPSVIAPKSSRVPGRLRIGGAIRARRLTSSKKHVITEEDYGSDSGGSGGGSEYSRTSGAGSGGVWDEFELGADTAQTF